MTLELQFKIKNNPYYARYLRENSNWYKILNIYNKNIFVCDFNNRDYFFLKETINSEFYKQNTYNKLGG